MEKENLEKKKSTWKKTVFKGAGLCIGLLILWFMVKDIIKNWEAIVPYLTGMKISLFLGISFNATSRC